MLSFDSRVRPCLRRLAAAFTLVSVLIAPTSWALIQVESPVTHIYDLAKLVLVGKVARLNAEEKSVEVEIVKVSKGHFAGDKVQVQLAAVNDYFDKVKLNEPVVVFSGIKSALVHMADNFLNAKPLDQTQQSKLVVTKVNPIQPTYPGKTNGLVRLVDEIASGHPTLLNVIEHEVWRGGIIDHGKVLANADYVITARLNGSERADVLIGNSKSVQLLINTGKDFKDETLKRGLRNASGKWAASGDINGDGRISLLIGQQFWVNRGHQFSPGPVLSLPTTVDILSVALLDVTGDGLPDAIFLTKSGDVYTFENPGRDGANWQMLPAKRLWNDDENADAAVFSNDWGDTGRAHAMVVRASGLIRYALDANDNPPADFERLTAQPLKVYNEIEESPQWNVMAAVQLDINGDGRQDLIVILDKGGPNLVNRGFGTFFLNPLPTAALHPSYQKEVPWRVTPKTRFGAGDLHGDKFDDLLIVTAEGRLFELNNTPYERSSNRFQ